jgi:hypothetical protein
VKTNSEGIRLGGPFSQQRLNAHYRSNEVGVASRRLMLELLLLLFGLDESSGDFAPSERARKCFDQNFRPRANVSKCKNGCTELECARINIRPHSRGNT